MSKTICRQAAALAAGLVWVSGIARGVDAPASLLGASSCASTSCHGGGGTPKNQYVVWSVKDFHSQRPPATLATARSKQIADALAIQDPTLDSRCTTCHAPLQAVPENQRGENCRVSEGISCESCHGAAGNWIRSHTRRDYTHADRVQTGLRDLQNLYVRANTCVACHQVVSPALLKAGHPELIFELDGQSIAEPKHWRAEKHGNGAQVWLIGQAVALRELSWQLANATAPTENQRNQWASLVWLLSTATTNTHFAIPPALPSAAVKVAGAIQGESDALAREDAELVWTDEMTRLALNALAGTSAAFQDPAVPQPQQARRAERLVLALDRLVAALPEFKHNEPLQAGLNELFKLAQSAPDFDPNQFAAVLGKFSAAVR